MQYLKNLIPLLLVLIACGTEPDPVPALLFSPDNITIDVASTGDVTLKIKDFEDAVFGVSLCVAYDSNLVSFNNMDGFTAGDFFGSDIVAFARAESSF
jgi:hypothetical protein